MTFERIYTFIIDRAPQLAAKNTHAIREWMAKGYDPEKDIIPAIEWSCKRGTASIYSFNFFSGSILKTHEARIKEQNTPKEVVSADKAAKRAEKIRWCIDRGLHSTAIGPADLAWLANYEKQEVNA